VVLAEAEDLDVARDDHVVRVRLEDRAVDLARHRLAVAVGQELEGAGHALWCLVESLAAGILADLDQYFADQVRDALQVHINPFSRERMISTSTVRAPGSAPGLPTRTVTAATRVSSRAMAAIRSATDSISR